MKKFRDYFAGLVGEVPVPEALELEFVCTPPLLMLLLELVAPVPFTFTFPLSPAVFPFGLVVTFPGSLLLGAVPFTLPVVFVFVDELVLPSVL
jgi:hypothetical protein